MLIGVSKVEAHLTVAKPFAAHFSATQGRKGFAVGGNAACRKFDKTCLSGGQIGLEYVLELFLPSVCRNLVTLHKTREGKPGDECR